MQRPSQSIDMGQERKRVASFLVWSLVNKIHLKLQVLLVDKALAPRKPDHSSPHYYVILGQWGTSNKDFRYKCT